MIATAWLRGRRVARAHASVLAACPEDLRLLPRSYVATLTRTYGECDSLAENIFSDATTVFDAAGGDLGGCAVVGSRCRAALHIDGARSGVRGRARNDGVSRPPSRPAKRRSPIDDCQ